MKRSLLILFTLTFFTHFLFSADEETTTSDTIVSTVTTNAQIAMANPAYPVTAGDVYTLAYSASGTAIEYSILIDSSYKVRVSNLAIIDATGKTFIELKNQVEAIVSKNYPLSGVQLVLITPALFSVIVRGEVKNTIETTGGPLSRLSSVIKNSLTSYSSNRDIIVTSLNGKSATFDLFKANRLGDITQDPYMRPGDIITINRIQRSVTIAGAVERPGTYQLLEGEELGDLVKYYASGLTPVADKNRIELIRYVESASVSGDKILLTKSDIDSNYPLQNFDSITVTAITELVPVMFIEGAIGPKTTANPEVSGREAIRFNKGENYASLVQRSRNLFTSISDTANAYIMRGGAQIPVNLNPMLYDAGYKSTYFVQDNDTLVIPFRQYFITVSGAVMRPDRYPYILDRNWDYYIALAGGFDTTRNNFSWIKITDVMGKKHSKKDPITPETVINATSNTVRYYFNQYSPVIVTTLAIITSYYTVKGYYANDPLP